jgi:hypothetical protein
MNDTILTIPRRAARKPSAGQKSGDSKLGASKLATSFSVELAFPWETLCDSAAETFRFTTREKADFAGSRTARLIAAIPFVAGCDEPERTALAHLAVYMTELRGGSSIGDHTPADNVSPFARLRLLASFKGGDPDIIRHGMSQLALVMLAGYERSREADLRQSVYNPLNDGSWDADAMRLALDRDVRACPCATLDGILPEVYGLGEW